MRREVDVNSSGQRQMESSCENDTEILVPYNTGNFVI
jgi:hypothetical protein